MFILTPDILRRIGPNISQAKADEYAPLLTSTMDRWEIDTFDEITMFLANLLHESGEFRWMAEIWGPTTQQLKYERNFNAAWPPTPSDQTNKVAYALGNDESGDGRRYAGHGPIQVTGKTNHLLMGFLLELDLVARPELLLEPVHGFDAAGAFWWNNRLDDRVRKGFVSVVKAINGGTTGLEDRQKYLDRATQFIPRF